MSVRSLKNDVVASAALIGLLATGSVAQVADDVVLTGTGAEFEASDRVEFFDAPMSVVLDRLEIDANVADAMLARTLVAEAGTYKPSNLPVRVLLDVELTRLSDDFDPVFVVSDGVHAIGGQIGDNPNGAARLVSADVVGDAISPIEFPFMFDNAGFGALGDTFPAQVEVIIRGDRTDVRVAFATADAVLASSFQLDATRQLEFVFAANSFVPNGERYGLDNITITRTGTCLGDIADSSGFGLGDGQIDFGDFFALSFLPVECPGEEVGCEGDFADSTGFGPPDGSIDFGDYFWLSFMSGPCP